MADDDTLSDQARSVLLAVYGAPDALPSIERLTAAAARLDADVEVLGRVRAAASTAPDARDVESACAAVHLAAIAQIDAERTADALSADRVQFLETSLEFRDRHGTQPCPVCDKGTLDDGWVVWARDALAAEQDARSTLRVARSEAHRARQRLTALVRAVEPPPSEDAGMPTIAAARDAYQAFSALPVDDDILLADHVARVLPDLLAAYGALRDGAAGTLEITLEAQKWLSNVRN